MAIPAEDSSPPSPGRKLAPPSVAGLFSPRCADRREPGTMTTAVARGSEMTPSFELTASDKLAAALEALDQARRTLEDLATITTGDGEIDDAVDAAAGTIEIKIAGLARLHRR